MHLAELADGGNTTYQRRDGVLCMLFNDEFLHAILGSDTLHSIMLR